MSICPLILLQRPLRLIDRVVVRSGATIERATGLRPDQIGLLDLDDRHAIEAAMARLARKMG